VHEQARCDRQAPQPPPAAGCFCQTASESRSRRHRRHVACIASECSCCARGIHIAEPGRHASGAMRGQSSYAGTRNCGSCGAATPQSHANVSWSLPLYKKSVEKSSAAHRGHRDLPSSSSTAAVQQAGQSAHHVQDTTCSSGVRSAREMLTVCVLPAHGRSQWFEMEETLK
jgi:hypothetical protein